MLYALISSRNEEFIDSVTREAIDSNSIFTDQSQYQNAKIILSHTFLENKFREKNKKINAQFYSLSKMIKTRNELIYNQQIADFNPQLEINFINFQVTVFYQTDFGVEIVSNNEFERVFSPCDDLQDQYYRFLQTQENQMPSFKQALDLKKIKNFVQSEENAKQLIIQICQNFICDQIITNLAKSVYVVSNEINDFDATTYLKDRPYFQSMFSKLNVKISEKYVSLYDVL